MAANSSYEWRLCWKEPGMTMPRASGYTSEAGVWHAHARIAPHLRHEYWVERRTVVTYPWKRQRR